MAELKGQSKVNCNMKRMGFLITLLMLLCLISGCATPVGVRYLDSREEYQKLTASVLSSGTLSAETTQILNRSGLAGRFQSDPAGVIATIHKGLPTAKESDRLFALAELSFLHASKGGDRSHFLSGAIYAYAFLFPEDRSKEPDSLDPRVRTAADLYNQGLIRGFMDEENRQVILKDGEYKIPMGTLTVTMDPNASKWGTFRLTSFVDASELEVRGLRNWYRWRGIGAPLVASLEHLPGEKDPAFAKVPPGIKVAATAFLRLENVEESLKTGVFGARMELNTTNENTLVTIGDRRVPLEFGVSSALAYTLEGSQAYKIELKGLLSGDFVLFKDRARFRDNVFLMTPYRPGRIPLVLVHGTASSPARWAQMLNEIQNDKNLWGRYQVWLFTYNTGNPIPYSGGILTESLRNTVKELDPEGKDPALRKMVVMGHSQGGLLTKLTVIDSGTRFWENLTSTPFEEFNISPETRELVRKSMFYKPLPFVKRVIFVSTPQRGSYVSGGWIGRLAGKLISFPRTLLNPLGELVSEALAHNPEDKARVSMKAMPKSTDNMDPKSPFIKVISSIPIAEGVIAHSIIPVQNPDDPKDKWNDGVVEYKSAHIDGVKSELIVFNSGHSAQDEPATIEEVKRILIENMEEK
jgi:pimeloyl-ACP methyl ester carboxylesterase